MKKLPEKIKKIEKLTKEIKAELVDITTEEDLMFAVMNLISLEEHFYMAFCQTKKDIYLELHDEIRKLRRKAMEKLIVNTESQVWCISKHLLACAMRLKEVADKVKDEKLRKELYEYSFDMIKIFKLIHKK